MKEGREEGDHPVAHGRPISHGELELLHLRAGDLEHAAAAGHREDVALEHAAVLGSAPRLLSRLRVLRKVSRRKLAQSERLARGVAVLGGITSRSDLGEYTQCELPRAVGRERSRASQCHVTRAPMGAVLHHVSLRPLRPNAQAEARKFPVPEHVVALFGPRCVDGALGEFRHLILGVRDLLT